MLKCNLGEKKIWKWYMYEDLNHSKRKKKKKLEGTILKF